MDQEQIQELLEQQEDSQEEDEGKKYAKKKEEKKLKKTPEERYVEKVNEGRNVKDKLEMEVEGNADVEQNQFSYDSSVDESNSTILTLAKIWTHCLLYHKNIYSSHKFCQRNFLGIPVYQASDGPIQQYLGEFFKNLSRHLNHLNHLQILIVSHEEKIIEVNTLHIQQIYFSDMFNDYKDRYTEEGGTIQEDHLMKVFIQNLNKKLKMGFVRTTENVSFRFRIGYRFEEGVHLQSDTFDDWIKRQRLDRKVKILSSLNARNLNIIYEQSQE